MSSVAEKPRYRVKARRLGAVVQFDAGPSKLVMEAYEEFRPLLVEHSAQAIGIVSVGVDGTITTHFAHNRAIHALAGGTMNLLYRLQHEGMDW